MCEYSNQICRGHVPLSSKDDACAFALQALSLVSVSSLLLLPAGL